HSSLLLTTAVLSFAGAIGLGAYRMKFLEEKFGVLEIPAIWESELVQAISWDLLAYTTIFSALILGGALASAVSPRLPLSIVPLVFLISIALLYSPHKFVVISLDLHQIIIGQLTPLFLEFAFELMPSTFELIAIHLLSSFGERTITHPFFVAKSLDGWH